MSLAMYVRNSYKTKKQAKVMACLRVIAISGSDIAFAFIYQNLIELAI
jgi:hypothetical protein